MPLLELEIWAQLATIFGVLAPTAVVALGIVPRIGPFRAFWLGMSCRYFSPLKFVSQRTDDLKKLNNKLAAIQIDQFITIKGPKGVGKTCLVKTAMKSQFGVVYVRVQPGRTADEIRADVYTDVARCYNRTLNNIGSSRRVLLWHKKIFRQPVTVVIQAAERDFSEKHASLDAAARGLTQDDGFIVVVDASINSLPERSNDTLREHSIELLPLSRDILVRIPELESLHANLNAAKLTDVVWACLGGNPALYFLLYSECLNIELRDLELVVTKFLQKFINIAIDKKNGQVIENKRFQELYDLFREEKEVSKYVLVTMKLKRPSPDKVLREVQLPASLGRSEVMLIPADAAMALVLRFDLKQAPSLEELKEMAGAK